MPAAFSAATGHICAFFNSVEEEHGVLRSFVKDGFERGDTACHFMNPDLWEDHLRWLAEAGIVVGQAMGTGQRQFGARIGTRRVRPVAGARPDDEDGPIVDLPRDRSSGRVRPFSVIQPSRRNLSSCPLGVGTNCRFPPKCSNQVRPERGGDFRFPAVLGWVRG